MMNRNDSAFVSHLPVTHRLRRRRVRVSPCVVQAVQEAATVRRVRREIGRNVSSTVRHAASTRGLSVSGDFLESTMIHRVKTYGFFSLAGLETMKLLNNVDTPTSLVAMISGILTGYLFADLGTGLYHWAVDNYGGEDTAIFGRQIAAFQGHHGTPFTIAHREFANNLHALTVPTTPQLLVLLGVEVPVGVAAFVLSALVFIVLSQEFHRQAHMVRSAPVVQVLQRMGLVIPRKMHMKHHKEPYGVNYCIVSGIWNKSLDDAKVFRRLEAIVFRITGNEPIAWALDPKLREEAMAL